jgi:hypothetical protein
MLDSIWANELFRKIDARCGARQRRSHSLAASDSRMRGDQVQRT